MQCRSVPRFGSATQQLEEKLTQDRGYVVTSQAADAVMPLGQPHGHALERELIKPNSSSRVS
jgi:hypothetical protein